MHGNKKKYSRLWEAIGPGSHLRVLFFIFLYMAHYQEECRD